MNVLVIPSWYPHRCFPREGAYVRDQAVMLGELRPDWHVGIALWHQGRNRIDANHARQSPRSLLCFCQAAVDHAPRERDLRENVIEWTHPAWQFPERVHSGNREAILKSVRASARRMTERWGVPDVLHAHVSYPGGWVATRLASEIGAAAVITEHMGPFPLPVYQRPDGALADFLREPLEVADARIAVSPALADQIARFGIERPVVVPNVIDERRYDPLASGDPGRFTFFTLCQMIEEKGVLDLLEAAARMLGGLPDDARARIRFRLAGKGPDLARFKAVARRLGLESHTTWLDWYLEGDEARVEFSRCDAFVLPSHHESFGMVFVEAMACGKPSIATRCGGPESILTPETGELVPVGDVPALADALARMVREAGRYDRAGMRAEFERRFSRRVMVDALEAVYRGALAQRDAARATTAARAR